MGVSIVLGLGFGDEGKGAMVNSLITDYSKTTVVRFSGGQQAGHTVINGGIKHIHSSYGSGTLRFVPTYITEHCVIDPRAMLKELRVLESKDVKVPVITFHPLAKITTPFDVISNQLDLKNREHGTCGMGVGKTMKRNEGPYKLFAIDLKNPYLLKQKLLSIAEYYKYRVIDRDNLIEDFIKDVEELPFEVKDYYSLSLIDNLIFEGSQGILLDKDHGIFPNVTYANTTSKNAMEVAKKIGYDKHDFNIYYMTRSYQTRHGNGWMSDERKLDLINNDEEINKKGFYQGNFRTGNLDYDAIKYALDIDNLYSEFSLKTLVVTCMDQLKDFEFDEMKVDGMFHDIFYSYSPEGINQEVLAN